MKKNYQNKILFLKISQILKFRVSSKELERRKKELIKKKRKKIRFTRDKTRRAFEDDIKNGGVMMYKANDEQNKLVQKIR